MQSRWDAPRFGELLAEILTATGLSQRALAKLGPVSPSLLSRWLAGSTQPSYGNLQTFITGLRRERPDLASVIPGLVEAAGYGGLGDEDRPQIVVANWADENIRTLWGLKAGEAQKLSLIEDYLAEQAGQARQAR